MLNKDDKQWIGGQLAQHLHAMEGRLVELLKGFQQLTDEIRSHESGLELRLNLIEERQNILSGRLLEIEKKLLMRPPE
jgi:hypothetical protein